MSDVVRLTNCTFGGPVFVYVKDGKIVRVTPIDFDETDGPSWKIEARGRTFTPPRKATIQVHAACYKSTVYSPDRILYPMKRVDFDHKGERNIQNRGISGFERISWEEALDIVEDEITRIKEKYGSTAIYMAPSSHHLWGNIGYRHSALFRFMNTMGFTYTDHNPDSWEGWHWGGMHMWGFSHRLGIPEQYGLLEDGLKHAEMIVFWSADPETTAGHYSGMDTTIRRKWLKDLGVKMVFIDPYFNSTAILFNDKWIAPRAGTDVALAHAIAYVWITEGLYDKEYVDTHTYGFDEWAQYILGKGEDGVPKTPEWAEKETTVPAYEIRALAREWARKNTYLAAGGLGGWGGACRSATGNEWARAMIALATMQGMGKPGSNIWSTVCGAPVDHSFYFPGYAEGGISGDTENTAAGYALAWRMFDGKNSRPVISNTSTAAGAHIPRLRIPECITNQRFEWRGRGFCGGAIEHQFHKYEHPAPGYPPIRMLYKYGGSQIGTMCETNRYARMYHSENLEFALFQSIWFEGETPFADLILPACTNFERYDISEFGNCSGYIPDNYSFCNHRVIVMQKKAIEPLGESKSDYEIFRAITRRFGLEDVFAEGKDELDWCRQMFYATDLPKYVTWEEFFEKGYFVVPDNDKGKPPVALRWFAEDRRRDTPDWGPRPGEHNKGGKGLQTTTGKVEFVSTSLMRLNAEDDRERPPMHQYIPSWEGHHTKELFEKYPLALISPHPRFSFHTMSDGKDSFVNDIKDHRMLIDGHYYWIIRINTEDAAERGIKTGDLVRAFNDRGDVILAAKITERVPKGVVHAYESCAVYKPLGKPGRSADIGGCVNILTPSRFITRYSCGMAPNSCLIQVKKWNGDKLERF